MRVQILSDLHNEFGVFEYDFSNIDLLILAGDIDLGLKGFEWISEKVKDIPVLYVLGNHEYYKHSYPKLLHKIKDISSNSNIHILEKESIIIENIAFHGTTLWTNFELFGDPKIAGYLCQQRMSDYKLIRLDPSYSKLRSINTHVMHYESLEWLRKSLLNSTKEKNFVITHHAPSIQSIANKYKEDILSAAFASNLDEFIIETKPDFWVHGHVHEPFDYYIGKTRIICNPKGYPDEPYTNYKSKFVIEI